MLASGRRDFDGRPTFLIKHMSNRIRTASFKPLLLALPDRDRILRAINWISLLPPQATHLSSADNDMADFGNEKCRETLLG
jgi:hypothetical protein